MYGRCLNLQSRYKDICNALIIDAKEDLKAAKILLDNSIYSKSVFHSQQVVEKALKAVLALNAIFITDEHVVSDKFNLLFSKFNQLKEVAEEAKFLERQGSKTRYPLFHNPIKPIWIPSREYKNQDAEKALQKADLVLKKILGFLKDRYGIN